MRKNLHTKIATYNAARLAGVNLGKGGGEDTGGGSCTVGGTTKGGAEIAGIQVRVEAIVGGRGGGKGGGGGGGGTTRAGTGSSKVVCVPTCGNAK